MNHLALNTLPCTGDLLSLPINHVHGWRWSMYLLCGAPQHAIRPHSMPLPGSSCIEAEVQEDVCRPRETFVAIVVSEY